MDSKKNILIIDDDKDFLEIFGTKLRSVGYNVTTAFGGEEGIETAKTSSPDLILLDVNMPGQNGIEVMDRIQKELGDKKLKVAFLTNYGDPLNQYDNPQVESVMIDKNVAINIGAKDFIRKSEDLDAVVSRVRQLLAP